MPTASMKPTSSLRDYQRFVAAVYGQNNERHYSVEEMLTNISRFAMRGLKGIRKDDLEKIKVNMVIAVSWFVSLMNQLGVKLEDSVWNRFPYLCSYCGECPCACKRKKVHKRLKIRIDPKLRPKTVKALQTMFNEILSYQKIGTSTIQSRAIGGVAGGTYFFALPGSTGACKDAWDDILVFQLDARFRPCNLVELMPRLQEHLRAG